MIDLWLVDAEAAGVVPRGAMDWLSGAERARLSRLRGAGERRRYLVSRVAVRGVLARATGLAPAELRFDSSGEEGGKPRLVAADAPAFNLSHAGGAVALAVSRGREVGVDLEPLAAAAELDPEIFLTDAEQAALPADSATRAREALRLWVQKEACAKLLGRGLERDPREWALPNAASGIALECREVRVGGSDYLLALASRER